MVNVMAHRGASSLAPENSMEAFRKAIELSSDYIELDIRRCKTGEIIVMHDMKVDRTTNGKGYVKKMTLSEIRKLVLKNNERVPTLEEVMDLVKGKCRLNIEIKAYRTDMEMADKIMDLAKEKKMEKEIMISSYNHRLLKYIKTKAPDIEIAALFIDAKNPSLLFRRFYYIGPFLRRVKSIHAENINLPHQFVTRKLVKAAMNQGVRVNVWTVNSDRTIERMKSLGVDGMITNFPQKFFKDNEKEENFKKERKSRLKALIRR